MSSFVLYGGPGAGKTTMAASFCKLGKRVHILDMDRKVRGMYHLQQFLDSGLLTTWEPKSALIADSMSLRAKNWKQGLTLQPKGYLEFAEELDRIGKIKEPEWDVLVLDSITRVNEHLRRMIMHVQGRPGIFLDDYGIILNNFEELFTYFFALPFEHTILIAHDRSDQDAVTGKFETRPLIDGQARDKVGSFVSEMYYLQPKGKADDMAYMALTKPDGRFYARTSMPIEMWVEADFEVIYAMVDQAKKGKTNGGKEEPKRSPLPRKAS